MAKDMSCARVKQCSAASIGATERHNERLNTDYANVNVVQERIPLNVHYRSPSSSYMETLRTMETAGTVSTRGLRKDATLFDEIIIDVNTMYFERNGGYEYAKKFYEEAYHFLEKKFGSEYVVAAVMHADEINKAATSDLGKDVYHYHLHAVVIPVVDKDILWSKRCKDPALRGTVRETIHQVSHSKKWASKVQISKVDIATGKELPGAELVIKDKEGNTVAQWVSEDKPHYIEKLPAGDYTLTEITAPNGYQLAESITFTVLPTGELQTVVMKDARIPEETPHEDTPSNTPQPTPGSTPAPTPAPASTPTTTPAPMPVIPQTGDVFPFALLSAAVFGSIVGFGIFAYKRRKSKPDESEH